MSVSSFVALSCSESAASRQIADRKLATNQTCNYMIYPLFFPFFLKKNNIANLVSVENSLASGHRLIYRRIRKGERTVESRLLCSRMTAQQPRKPVTMTRPPASRRIYADTANVLEASRLK